MAKIARSPRPRRGSRSRVAVLAWAVAAVAGLASAASFVMDHRGVEARVSGETHASLPAAEESAPAAPIDPRSYRKPPPADDGRPRIAIILRGLGISERLTGEAIAGLPPEITLALSPYGRGVQKTADAVRAANHELFLDMPVEPSGYPANDAGPEALLAALTAKENIDRLTWSVGRFTGYAGIVLPPASPFLDSPAALAPVLAAPAAAGLVWAHAPAKAFDGARIDSAAIVLSLDETKAEAIEAALEKLEAKARSAGAALAIAAPYPVTVDVLKRWAGTLDARGFQLVPASALAGAPAS